MQLGIAVSWTLGVALLSFAVSKGIPIELGRTVYSHQRRWVGHGTVTVVMMVKLAFRPAEIVNRVCVPVS